MPPATHQGTVGPLRVRGPASLLQQRPEDRNIKRHRRGRTQAPGGVCRRLNHTRATRSRAPSMPEAVEFAGLGPFTGRGFGSELRADPAASGVAATRRTAPPRLQGGRRLCTGREKQQRNGGGRQAHLHDQEFPCDLGMPAPQTNWCLRRHPYATRGRSSWRVVRERADWAGNGLKHCSWRRAAVCLAGWRLSSTKRRCQEHRHTAGHPGPPAASTRSIARIAEAVVAQGEAVGLKRAHAAPSNGSSLNGRSSESSIAAVR